MCTQFGAVGGVFADHGWGKTTALWPDAIRLAISTFSWQSFLDLSPFSLLAVVSLWSVFLIGEREKRQQTEIAPKMVQQLLAHTRLFSL